MGDYYAEQYAHGNRDVIAPLTREEPNLLHARRMARANEWWHLVIGPMQGLRHLYGHTGRRAEWKRLVEEITSDFVDPTTDAPLPGLEDQWLFLMQYRDRLAQEERNWEEAERLIKLQVEWNRKQAAPYLEMPPEKLEGAGRNVVRSLAVSVEQLGHIQREMNSESCAETYEESLNLFEHIYARQEAAQGPAFNLGRAYNETPAIRDLEKAKQWYARSLELRDERDRQGQAQCLGQMGRVALEQFNEARAAQKPKEELLEHINTALRHYHTALEMIPADAVDDLAVTHNQLGAIYFSVGDVESGVKHWRNAVSYHENAGNYFRAAETRRNIAVAFAQSNRIPDALDYARAALRNFEMYGDRAADIIEQTKGLIQQLSELG